LRCDTSSARGVDMSQKKATILTSSAGVPFAKRFVASPTPPAPTFRCLMISKIVCVVPACLFLFASDGLAEDVVDLAASLIGRPYAWGAEGPDAFDCSGLTQYVYREFAVDLPRRAISQSKVGDRIKRTLQRGDLIFFSSDTRKSLVTHVGIYERAGTMIEASKRYGQVRRSNIDDAYW